MGARLRTPGRLGQVDERERQKHPTTSTRRGTVLVIDDDPDIVEVLVIALHDNEGFPMRTAHSVGGALAAREPDCEPPALILLDATLLGEEISAAAARLRSHPGWEGAHLILCSGREDVDILARSLDAADYLRKPFDLDNLIAVAERHAGTPAPEGMI